MSDTPQNQPESRRPLAVRQNRWAAKSARYLTQTGITPNQISVLCIIFSLAALACYFWFAQIALSSFGLRALALVGAILCIQGRLLCNLFDGMVAMEGGKAGPDGPFWNEFPDRIADIMIIVGVGVAAGQITLGWTAACLAVFVSYVRELGRANGLEADFSGPMAKQHRMAILTLATFLAIFEPYWQAHTGGPAVLRWSLYAIILGSIVTILRRAAAQVKALKAR